MCRNDLRAAGYVLSLLNRQKQHGIPLAFPVTKSNNHRSPQGTHPPAFDFPPIKKCLKIVLAQWTPEAQPYYLCSKIAQMTTRERHDHAPRSTFSHARISPNGVRGPVCVERIPLYRFDLIISVNLLGFRDARNRFPWWTVLCAFTYQMLFRLCSTHDQFPIPSIRGKTGRVGKS